MKNEDNIKKAIKGLNIFMHNWCMNVEKTNKTKDLVFNCDDCEFSTENHFCLLKVFAKKHIPEIKDFGAMGD